MTVFKTFLLFAVVALLPLVPYALFGYSGHDFEFHVTSWIGVSDAWHAHASPGWSEGANFGLGDPHPLFYPPASFYLGGLLLLLFPLRMAPGIYAWLVFFLSGMAMYRASKQFVDSPKKRVLAAVLYMLSPYLLTTGLIRFAAAELLVQALLPLTFVAFYETMWRKRPKALLVLAVLLGLAWLTNLPGAIVLLYTLATVSLVIAWVQRSPLAVLRFVLAEAVSVALAAFYLAPVWTEQKWINHADLDRFGTRRGLMFMHQVSNTGSLTSEFSWLFAFAGIAIIVAAMMSSPRPAKASSWSWLYLASVSFFFMTPLSIPLWSHLPELSAVGFGFRFVSGIGVVVPLVALARGVRSSIRLPIYAALGFLALLPIVGVFHVDKVAGWHQPDLDSRAAQWAKVGFPGAVEQVPVDAHPSALKNLEPVVATEGCDATLAASGVATRTLRISSAVPCQARLATLFYPWWRAVDESGVPVPVSKDPTGLLSIAVSPGQHTVTLFFRASSALRTGSAIVSLVALILVVVSLIFYARRNTEPQPA